MTVDTASMPTRRVATAGKTIDVFEDDLFLVSYPRSGNTWMRWLLAVALLGRRDVDFAVVRSAVPDIYRVDNVALQALSRPRIIKSHERYNAGYPNVIYLYRDVRDVIVSLNAATAIC